MKKRIMVDMSVTLLHHGHIRLLKKAAELGDVIVGLSPDSEVQKSKGYWPELGFDERKEILESIKYVKEVVPVKDWILDDAFLDEHHCDYLLHGADNVNHVSPERLIILPRTEGVSSTELRERVLDSLLQINRSQNPGNISKAIGQFIINAVKDNFKLEEK